MSAGTTRAPYWPVPLARAIPAIVVGLVITFSADHTALFGLVAFGAFAIITGAVIAWGSFRLDDRMLRGVSLTQAAVSALAGIVALVFCTSGPGALFLVVIAFAAVTGFLELYLGLRGRGRHPASREWLTLGVMTALLAIAVLIVPADYALPWSAEDKGVVVSGLLTSQIIVVGIIGAYAILVGVFLVIGGLSARWAAQEKPATAQPATERD
ncbi:hypothetical protein GCM10022239_02860 [Leifsonia bigeumensis]|uniref:DUF308 domain-containing protein n=1 Tax=Leifsonella bigeumensis TaxID=433643 RepID=A0ABP7F1Y1_9MICO